METGRNITTIYDLPEDILLTVAQYLSIGDLDACYHVCRWWRNILNTNSIWKKHCIYPEKYFKYNLTSSQDNSNQDVCTWRGYYERQQRLRENWSKGKFSVESTGIYDGQLWKARTFMDNNGKYWLFSAVGIENITVWSVSKTSRIQRKIDGNAFTKFHLLTDKFLTYQCNYVNVFQFKYPDYDLKLMYIFFFDSDCVIPDKEIVSDYLCFSALSIIQDDFFIGYFKNVTKMSEFYMHIWDLSTAKKMATMSVHQQSFIDYLLSNGVDVTEDLDCDISLFKGDSGRFLVVLIEKRTQLCQVSVFSLSEMKFANVVVQFKSRKAWCVMKKDYIAIHYPSGTFSFQISVYNVNGQFLAKLNFPLFYNPSFTNEFWFSGTRVILAVNLEIHVLTIDSNCVREHSFDLDEKCQILSFIEPKFVLLYPQPSDYQLLSVSVWDVDLGCMLWTLGVMPYLFKYCLNQVSNFEYPGKILVQLENDNEIKIFNFEGTF